MTIKRILIAAAGVFAVVPAIVAVVVKLRAPAISAPDAEEIELTAALDSISLRSVANPLRGGRVRGMMSGVELDLRGVTLPEEGADLDVRSVMSGVEILVPEGWPVKLEHRTLLGGTEDYTDTEFFAATGPALRIHVLNIMSGVEIVQEPSLDWDEPDDIAGIPIDD